MQLLFMESNITKLGIMTLNLFKFGGSPMVITLPMRDFQLIFTGMDKNLNRFPLLILIVFTENKSLYNYVTLGNLTIDKIYTL